MKKLNLLLVLLLALSVSLPGSLSFAAAKNAKDAVPLSLTEKININSATVDLLTTVPGVGPKTAKNILDYREKNGSFKTVEDLTAVKGIGEKSLAKMKPYLTI